MKRFKDLKRVDEEVQIDEVSMETLTSYKKKAGEQASAMNKAVGEVAKSSAAPEHKKAAIDALVQKGNKRFSGIIQATKKQFAKSVKEEVEELDEVNYAGWSFDDLHKHLKKNGWDLDRSTGHKQYVHPKSARPIAVPHKHGKTVAPGTVRNIHQKMKEFIQEADESGSQQDNLTLASRTFKEKPNKEPMHKYDKEKIQEANYLVTVQHHDSNGEKGQRTHKIYNVTDPVRPELHAKNIAMMRHKKWAAENGVKLNQYMPIETKKLDESRRLEIIKEVVKKKNETKLKTGDKFQPEPVLSSTVVKET
jgi:predicted RNA binding protein YcfA (HicA-like mRNA interferase family)